ncbi:carbohydrate ABC transporter permease [Clostridiaceae bacterium OttesenSCG-928-D20]|nr:carbohydrate ABC transporter permease [Clostridiaceae bacterium OttesenSCG-928-D20]
MNKRKKGKSLKIKNMSIGSHVVLLFWSAVVIFPLYIMIINSFKDRLSIYKNTFGLPETWNISNYTDVLKSGDFMIYFRNSLLVVIVSLALVMFLGVMVSYALAHWKGKIAYFVYFLFIGGMMMPIKIASIRLIELVKSMGLLNKAVGLIPIYVAMGLPIAVFVLTEFIRQIPKELTEAALIDGSGRLAILLRIIVPLTRPALATVAIYNLVPFWNDLWFPLILISDEKQKTLLLGVTRLFGQYQTDWSKVLAVLTLSSIPVLLLYLLLSKQFIKGLTAGAVKG